MASVAVLGLGAMGSGMALSLIDAGHETLVWNRTPDAYGGLQLGATTAIRECFESAIADGHGAADVSATYLTVNGNPVERGTVQ